MALAFIAISDRLEILAEIVLCFLIFRNVFIRFITVIEREELFVEIGSQSLLKYQSRRGTEDAYPAIGISRFDKIAFLTWFEGEVDRIGF